jgi:hypothetical protein
METYLSYMNLKEILSSLEVDTTRLVIIFCFLKGIKNNEQLELNQQLDK